MPRTKKIMVKIEGEITDKWVQVDKQGQPLKSQNKLKGKKIWGYGHADFKKWGQQGGRPRKWSSEAERKRAYRLRKKQQHPKL